MPPPTYPAGYTVPTGKLGNRPCILAGERILIGRDTRGFVHRHSHRRGNYQSGLDDSDFGGDNLVGNKRGNGLDTPNEVSLGVSILRRQTTYLGGPGCHKIVDSGRGGRCSAVKWRTDQWDAQ